MKRISMLFLAVLFATGYVFADSPRMILVEEFTNSANGNSANQNPVLQNFIENNSDKIIPIAFHMAQSDPEEDIFYLHNQAMSETRKNFYNIETPPMLLVNGKRTMAEDGSVSGMPADTAAIVREMNKYTAVSPIDITVTETRNGNNVQLNIDVASSTSLAGKKLRVAAAEFACTYPNGEAEYNGESQYYWVARKMYDNASGSTIIDDNFSRTVNATIDSEWDANKIYFIVWIQDDSSKEVLQAATTMKPMAMMQINPNFADVTDLFTKVKRNNSVSHDFTVMNDNSVDLEFKFSKLESMPEDWNVTISPETANIPAGGSTIVKVTINAGEQASFVSAGLEANIISNDYFSYAKNSIFYSLLEETKYVYYRTAEINHAYISGATNSYINAIYNTPSHKKDFAVLPFINQIFQAYNPLDFDCIIMNNITPSDVVTQTLPFNEVIPQLSNLMMQSGKGVLLISDVSGYWAFKDKANRPEMYNFLYNKLGLEFAKNEDVVDFAQGQLFMREIKGTAGDPVTGGMNFTINGGYQQTGPTDFLL